MSLASDRIAGAVITFARLDYLEQCLDSLHAAHGSEHIDWYLYADHPYNERLGRYMDEHIPHRDIQDDTVALAEAHPLEFEAIHRQPENVDIIGQKHATHQLFDDDDYEYVITFENDLVVGPHYLQNCHSATRQFPMDCVRMFSLAQDGDPRTVVRETAGPRLWGYELSRPAWRAIEADWHEYYDLMSATAYRKRQSNPNRAAIQAVTGHPEISHDVALSNIMFNRLEGKLRPRRTRARYIGKRGNYAFGEDHWQRKGFDGQPEQVEYEVDPVSEWKLSK